VITTGERGVRGLMVICRRVKGGCFGAGDKAVEVSVGLKLLHLPQG
jgi:hypothetical protein